MLSILIAMSSVNLLLCSVFLACNTCEALKCYGADAFEMANRGEKDCYKLWTGYLWSPCWAKCGGVTLFSNDSWSNAALASSDPSGEELCPYRQLGENDYSTELQLESTSRCNCSGWREPLPGNTCPKCDDFNVIPPLLMSTRKDARSAGIGNNECPEGLDMCFNYCVTYNSWFPEVSTECAYGCMKSSNKPAIELMVSSMLSEFDYQNRLNSKSSHHKSTLNTVAVIYNPVEYTCGKVFKEKTSWLNFLSSSTNYVYTSAFGCETVFCTEDGCNQRAGFADFTWFHTYVYNPIVYGIVGLVLLWMLARFGLLTIMLCKSLSDSYRARNVYAEIPTPM